MSNQRVSQNDILFLSISMFVIVAAWIGFNVYHAYVTSTISQDLQMQIIPISSKFDTQTLDSLKIRKKVVPIFEGTLSETPTPTASPTATPVVVQDEEFINPTTPSVNVTTTPLSITPTSLTPTIQPTISP